MDIERTDDRFAPDVNTELHDAPALPAEAIETPLAAADEAALEAGIASLFETLMQEDAAEEADDEDGIEPTIALLAELNRLWAQPLAA